MVSAAVVNPRSKESGNIEEIDTEPQAGRFTDIAAFRNAAKYVTRTTVPRAKLGHA